MILVIIFGCACDFAPRLDACSLHRSTCYQYPRGCSHAATADAAAG